MRNQRQKGLSLVEAVIVVFIGSLFTAAMLGIAAIQNATNFRAYNKMSSLIEAKRVEPFLEREVHMANFFGDKVGTKNGGVNTSSPLYFPSSNNPISYTYPSSWPPGPYLLNKHTLVVQVPVFEVDGTVLTLNGEWNLDTYVYKILPDQANPGSGQFIMQKVKFPGFHSPPQDVSPPQTVVRGIVGPIDPNDPVDPLAGVPTPSVFTYILSQPGNKQVQIENFNNDADLERIQGVSINLEIFSNENSNRPDYVPQTTAFKLEFFRRLKGAF